MTFLSPAIEFFNLFIEPQKGFIASDVELSSLHRGLNGAPFITLMFAISEETLPGQLLDVCKALTQGLLVGPHLNLPNAGIVHQHPSVLQNHQLSGYRGMAAFSGHFVDLTGP